VIRQQSFFPPQSALRCLHRRFAKTPASLVRPAEIELIEPLIEIGLQLIDRAVELFSERNAVELVQHGFVKALDDAIGPRTSGFGAGVVDILDAEIELVFVPLGIAAIFGSAIGQHALQFHALLVEEGNDAVVQEISCRERRRAPFTVELRIPKLRKGCYFPGFLEPPLICLSRSGEHFFDMAEKALTAVIQEASVQGSRHDRSKTSSKRSARPLGWIAS
jgi:hypothetical protein